MAKTTTSRKAPSTPAATPKKASVKTPAAKSTAAKPTVKKTVAKKATPAAKAPAKKVVAKKAAPAAKAPVKTRVAKKAAPGAKGPAKKPAAAPNRTAAAAKATKAATTPTTPKAPAKAPAKAAAKKAAPAKAPTKAVPAKKAAPAKVKSPFDAKFLESQRLLLLEERGRLLRDADILTAEAYDLAQGRDPGDVQFDEESGEGDTLQVERERDLALSAQFRIQVEEIDRSLLKFDLGTYGICEVSGTPIPKERLKAIPWARERVEYKVGGFGRR